jgi:hypothetical protein
MLREYIISEAMNSLGIPTTRSLAVVTTGETVIRETPLPGAILTRVAASHIRVGTFQYVSNRGTVDELRLLADYTINRHFPGIKDAENRYLSLIEEVIKRQAELIAGWQLVGFIHGVMNTDNMAISGETIDYGPVPLWILMIRQRYSARSISMAVMHTAISPILPDGILHGLPRPYCRCCMKMKIRLLNWPRMRYSGFGELYYRNWVAGMRAKLAYLTKSRRMKPY